MPTPRGRSPRKRLFALVLAAAVVVVGIVLAVRDSKNDSAEPENAAWAGLAGSPRSNVALGQRAIVVLRASSLASRVRAAGGRASDSDERLWQREALAEQRSILARLAIRGAAVEPAIVYTRVLNGFAAALDPGTIAVLERSPEVEGVYPVRVTYPAALDLESFGHAEAFGSGYRPNVRLAGYDGRGVTIALLDTGIDRLHDYLRGRVLSGFDLVDGNADASAVPRPDDRSQLERHATQIAGIVVGPAAFGGIAPGASILPIRVAGWQRDASGAYSLYGRTDQLIAGLELAVDPNRDGNAQDGVRIALVGVSAPFAAFPDGPEARAVAGAAALDTLVIAPAGNDGSGGTVFGTIGAPGGASSALTVGALDLRSKTEYARVVIRRGLRTLYNETAPLGSTAAPKRALTRSLASGRSIPSQAGELEPAPSPESFFDKNGFSLVAGKVALVPAGDDPRGAARNAALAGAVAVVLYGDFIPSGALGLDENVNVPVVSVPARIGRRVKAALAGGDSVGISIGRPVQRANGLYGRVAPFSARGLAFDGGVKPDLVAAGVGIATSDAGMTADELPAFATVSGSSASAAVIAGAAALLAQARPDLDGSMLRSLLSTSAKPVRNESIAAQGAGVLDLDSAMQTIVVAEPASLTFPRLRSGKKTVSRTLVVRNLDKRPVFVAAGASQQDKSVYVRTQVRPRSALIPPRRRVTFTVTLRLTGQPTGESVLGIVSLKVGTNRAYRVPWSLRVAASEPLDLIADARLSRRSFVVSDTAPVVLSLEVGRVTGTLQREIRPARRVDVELLNDDNRNLGVLARLRDVLPGRYLFGLTGRSPAGAPLEVGSYRLRIVATPSGGGARSVRVLRFAITAPNKKQTSNGG